MLKSADIHIKDNQANITGDLTLMNVMSVYQKSLAYLHSHTALQFDFSQLTSSDSAGLALLVEWIKFAKSHQRTIQFTHLPTRLLALAEVSGLSPMIER